jgi:hypothetical protein
VISPSTSSGWFGLLNVSGVSNVARRYVYAALHRTVFATTPNALSSNPRRSVSPTFSKCPSFVSAPLLMKMRSSRFEVRKADAVQYTASTSSRASLPRVGDDLFEGRVGHKRIREPAGIFRIGTAQLGGVGTREATLKLA